MQRETRDIWVGLFVLVALGLAVALPIAQRRMAAAPHYTLYAQFDQMAGLTEGAAVKFRGYTIGRIAEIAFNPTPAQDEAYFHMRLAIDPAFPVFEGTEAEAKAASPIGEKFVDLVVQERTATRLEDGDRIPGVTSSDIDRSLARVPEMLEKITTMAQRIGAVNWQPTIHGIGDNVRKMRHDFEGLSRGLQTTLIHTDSLLGMTNARIDALTRTIDESAQNSQVLMDSVAVLVSQTSTQLSVTLATLTTTLTQLNHFVTHMDTMTTENRTEMREILTNINAATTSLADLLKHPLKAFTGGVK